MSKGKLKDLLKDLTEIDGKIYVTESVYGAFREYFTPYGF